MNKTVTRALQSSLSCRGSIVRNLTQLLDLIKTMVMREVQHLPRVFRKDVGYVQKIL
jgi:hypothetical protein